MSEQKQYLFVLFVIKNKQQLPSNSEDGKRAPFARGGFIRPKEILHFSPRKGGTPTPAVKPRHAALLESGGQICHAPDLPLQAAAAQKPPAQGLDLDGGTLPLLQLPALLPGLARLVEELGFGGLAGAEHFRSL